MFLSTVTLNSHSDGTHSLQSKWCNAKFLQICSDEETNSSYIRVNKFSELSFKNKGINASMKNI